MEGDRQPRSRPRCRILLAETCSQSSCNSTQEREERWYSGSPSGTTWTTDKLVANDLPLGPLGRPLPSIIGLGGPTDRIVSPDDEDTFEAAWAWGYRCTPQGQLTWSDSRDVSEGSAGSVAAALSPREEGGEEPRIRTHRGANGSGPGDRRLWSRDRGDIGLGSCDAATLSTTAAENLCGALPSSRGAARDAHSTYSGSSVYASACRSRTCFSHPAPPRLR